ncbi:MAG: hypothetical protein AUI93_05120 [Crenarchaeota archaeon 13_1_40CM_3_52_10]|nr:MAG: hypothetical protein AUI93_05120 [Crenarchaeota archaeon 13_1_40CM_3_52_10]
MRQGILVPYGFVMAPIGAGLVVLLSFFAYFGGAPDRLLSFATSLVLGVGMIEVINSYLVIRNARAASVQRTRTIMHVGFVLFIAQFAFLAVPDTASRVFSAETPFPQAFEWVGFGALLLSSCSLGGASWMVWDRWSQIGVDELEIPNWTRGSWHHWAFLSGIVAGTVGIFLDPFSPAVTLVLFSAGVVLLLAGIFPSKVKETQLAHGSETPPKVELRKVTYEEKLGVGKRACALILQKYGNRRVFAVCMWGDEIENSQPYFGVNLLTVVRDGFQIPSEKYLFDGIEVKITYWQEIGILHRARTFDEEWPWHSGLYRTRIVLHEKKGWFRKLDTAVRESDSADPANAIRESAMLLLGHLATLRDYQLLSDLVGEKAECWRIAWGAIELIFLLNHRYVRHDYWNEVFECPIQTSDLHRQLEILLELTDTPIDVMVEVADKLCEELFDVVRARGKSLVSSELRV